MSIPKVLLAAVLLVAIPAAAEVTPISEVNEDQENGDPVLLGEVVTVRGVVVIGTGVLAPNTDIYIDDGTVGGRRLLPEGWRQYVSTPTTGSSSAHRGAVFWEPGRSAYGAGFWLKLTRRRRFVEQVRHHRLHRITGRPTHPHRGAQTARVSRIRLGGRGTAPGRPNRYRQDTRSHLSP